MSLKKKKSVGAFSLPQKKQIPLILTDSRRDFLKTLGVGTAAMAVPAGINAAGTSNKKPNIIIIMSDDMGYSDIGCYGGEIRTPILDKLAENGLRFTQFYNTGRCCPTRASLLTGLYPHQAGVGHMMNDRRVDGYRGDLNKNCLTIAEVLKPAGYGTYMVGKWHVTRFKKSDGEKHNWPLQRGFDRFYGTITGAGSFYDPATLTRDNTQITPVNDKEYKPKTYYYTDAISDHAARFIKDHYKKNNNKPFFMYVAYTTAHWPMHALPKDIAKYKGRYDRGWDVVRKERHQRMLKMGLAEKKWEMSERDKRVPAWKEEPDKEWNARCMEVYAAMIDNMDQGIGRIADELKSQGKLENTLIFFLQDNGGCAEPNGRKKKKTPHDPDSVPRKPMGPDELQSSGSPKYTRDGRPVRRGRGVMPGPADTYLGYGIEWANVSNTPFRMYKHYVHEGGISTPLIAYWPDRIKAKGEFRPHLGHLVDLMATCVDIAGAKYPSKLNGNKITPMEGKSLVPAFDNENIEREALYWEHEGNCAIRIGKWKLVSLKGKGNKWELYDIEADRGEMKDLAEDQPERVKKMSDLWHKYANRANVIPWPAGRKKKVKQKNKKKK